MISEKSAQKLWRNVISTYDVELRAEKELPGETLLRISSYLVVQEGFGLFDISQEEVEDVSLDQNFSPALPHLQEFVPADVELLQPLLQGGLR